MRARHLLFSCLALPICLAIACSDDETEATPAPEDAGPDTAPVVPANETESKQTGRIVKAREPDYFIEGATITIAGRTATSNAAGEYEIIVPRNTPYQMTVTAPEYWKLVEQEWMAKKETLVRGDTTMLPNGLAKLLTGVLPARKAEKGVLLIRVNPLPPCTTEDGSTVTIDPPGEALHRYFDKSGLPSDARDAVEGGQTLSVAFYNVEVGVPITVKVNSPLCEQLPFPIDIDGITYTGLQKTEPGDVISYIRTYIGPPKTASDAGPDGADAGADAPDGD